MFLEDQIICDEEKSDESQSYLEVPNIPTLISPPVVNDDHMGVENDNNNSPT